MRGAGTVRRKFGRIILAAAVVCFGSALLYLGIERVFSIETILVVGTGVNVVVDESKIPKNLLFFPSARIRAEVLSDNPILSDVQFRKKFPHTLEIVPILRSPFATISSGGRLVDVDTTGVILADRSDRGTAPLISVNSAQFIVGEPTHNKAILLSLAFLSKSAGIITTESITEADESSLRVKAQKSDILIAQDWEIDQTVATLQTLLAGFRIKGTLPKVIDLRFDKPIVTF